MKLKTPIFLILIALAITGIIQPAHASVRIFACEPEWGALAQEIGGDDVSIYTATQAMQDPHHIQARPSLIARMRRADMLIATGAQLEIGWLPVLLRQAANTRVQHGQPGYFAAANYVRKLDVPTRVDRAMGDIHPAGNPHIQTDPHNIAHVAAELVKRLRQIDPAHADAYQARYNAFSTRWQAAMLRWVKEAAPLRGVRIVVYHKGWAYMNRWLGLIEAGTLEPVPGIPPTTSHLAELLAKLKVQPAVMVIYAAYQDPRAAEWLAGRAHIPPVKLAFTVGGTPGAKDLFGLYGDTITRLLAAATKTVRVN
ncbi:MAG: zinc ABC transporter substrate-binding protein [Mariprofundaceae bacterium]|nr:zinc ABC transporter substrate-binding protein [Mariprofundaceae bacterium]